MAKGIRSVWKDSDSPEAIGNKVFKDDVEIADIPNGVQEYKDPDVVVNRQYKYVIQSYTPTSQSTDEVLGANLNYYTIVQATGTKPVLINFKVMAGQPSRIYFDSVNAEPIGLTTEGIFLSDGSKTVTGVVLNTGSLTGHYFTVDVAFNFWENYTIRLGEILDTSDRQTVVRNFSMEDIENQIDEPIASNFVYVEAGASGGNGSEGSPYNLNEVGTQPAGTTVWIKAGDYTDMSGGEGCQVNSGGTPTAPVKYIGYKDVIGDLDNYRFIDEIEYTTWNQMKDIYDPSQYPYIHSPADNVQDKGFVINGAENIVVKNIAMAYMTAGINTQDGAENQFYENVMIGVCQDNFQVNANTYRMRIKEVVTMDCDMTALGIAGNFHSVENCRAYSGATQMPEFGSNISDYSIGGVDMQYCKFVGSLIKEYEGDNWGHGLGMKTTDQYDNIEKPAMYNLFVGNETRFIDRSENLYCRHRNSHDNVFKRNIANNVYALARPGGGSHGNLWEYNKAISAEVFIGYNGTGESEPWHQPAPLESIYAKDNVIRNNIATNVGHIMQFVVRRLHNEPSNTTFLFENEQVYNNTILDVAEEFIWNDLEPEQGQTGWSYSFIGTEFRNNLITVRSTNTDNFYRIESQISVDPSLSNNNILDAPSSWSAYLGTGITTLDPNFVDEVDFVPQAVMECPVIFGAELDYSENERANPTTRGAVKGLNEL